MNPIRVGSRGSALALKQTALFCDAVRGVSPECGIEVCPVLTSGDRKQGTPLASQGDKKDWIAELEAGLASGEIDIAIHSAKDVPIDIHPDTELVPILARATPFEALVLNGSLGVPSSASLRCLPAGTVVGTASLRRNAQIRWVRPDLEISPVRGNVPTRVRKLDEENLGALVLAAAGLQRLGLTSPQMVLLGAEEMLPAVNQGILAAQVRRGDPLRLQLLDPICDRATSFAFESERAVIATIGADCHSAVGVFARLEGATIVLRAEVYARDERRRIEGEMRGETAKAVALGHALGEFLIEKGAKELL